MELSVKAAQLQGAPDNLYLIVKKIGSFTLLSDSLTGESSGMGNIKG